MLAGSPEERVSKTVGIIYIQIASIYIPLYVAVYTVNGKANLHIDLKNLILINICLILLILNDLVLFK